MSLLPCILLSLFILSLSYLLCYSLHIVSCFLLLYFNFFHPCLSPFVSCLSSLPSSIILSYLHAFLVSSLYSAFYLHLLTLPVSSCLCLVLSLFLSYHYFVCSPIILSLVGSLLTFPFVFILSPLNFFFVSFPL